MEVKVNFKDSYLILDSQEAVDQYEALEKSGMLWERISDLFNLHAKGSLVSAPQETITKSDIESLLLKHVSSFLTSQQTGVGGYVSPPSPSLFVGSDSIPQIQQTEPAGKPKIKFGGKGKGSQGLSAEEVQRRIQEMDGKI